MTFTEAVKHCFANYANFNGRAGRSEYWYFVLFNTIAGTILTFITPNHILGSLYYLAVLLPSLSVACRRLHDTGRSGLWLFIALIPLVGTILLIVWLCQAGVPSNGTAPGPVPGRVSGYTAFVECLSGPMQGQTFPVGAQGMLFGRTSNCAVRFPDGAPGISARHCRLSFNPQSGSAVLMDLGSTYGTFLNDGTRLPVNYPHLLGSGCFYLANRQNLFRFTIKR